MAIILPRLSPIRQAKTRRLDLPRYLRLDTSRYLFGVFLVLCLVGLITLAQVGVVATKGYAIANFERQRIQLLRERAQLQYRQAEAQSLTRVRLRAGELGLRTATPEQLHFVVIPPVMHGTGAP